MHRMQRACVAVRCRCSVAGLPADMLGAGALVRVRVSLKMSSVTAGDTGPTGRTRSAHPG